MNVLKAGANHKTLLQKQNCIQEARTVFQNIFCYLAKHRIFVFNICKMQAKKRKHMRNNEGTVALNMEHFLICILCYNPNQDTNYM